MPTATDLTQRVIRRIAQVSGTSVQTYAEDLILEQLQHGFDVLFDEYYWPEYSGYSSALALDGSTGVVTASLASVVTRFKDIGSIWYGSTSTKFDKQPLPRIPKLVNPLNFAGTRPKGYTYSATAGKVFNVWPKASTGYVVLYARLYPATNLIDDPDQEVCIDDQLLILKTAYDYLEDDGSNPGAADKFLAMFDARLEQIKHLLNKGPFVLDENINQVSLSWEERP